MKDLQTINEIFNTPRTVTTNEGQVWFVAKDVAQALGYSKTKEAIRLHCTQQIVFKELKAEGASGPAPLQVSTLMINRADLNRLVLGSTLPKAKEYESWVMGEVLPEIQDQL